MGKTPPSAPRSGFDIAKELQDFNGLAKALSDKEIKKFICQYLRDEGCSNISTSLIYRTLVFGTRRIETFTGQIFSSQLQKMIDKWPFLSALLQKIINLKHGEKAKNNLKLSLIQAIGNKNNADFSEVEYDESSSLELLIPLYTSRRLNDITAQLDELSADLLVNFQDELDTQFSDLKQWFQNERGPELSIPEELDLSITTAYRHHSLHYTSGINQLIGREKELIWLEEFAGDPGELREQSMFRWMLITGPGGSGKSRLAFDFVKNKLAASIWDRGFLPEEQLDLFLRHSSRWRPRQPYFLVIDYPRSLSKKVGKLLEELARNQRNYEFPVRLLLLERTADVTWTRKLVRPTQAGIAVEKSCHTQPKLQMAGLLEKRNQREIHWELPPLDRDDIIRLMIERFKSEGISNPPPETVLYRAAAIVDRRSSADKASGSSRPRALFAAATADEYIIQYKNRGSWPLAFKQEEVLRNIIDRDRRIWWKPAAKDNSELLRYEYALALATLTGGIQLSSLAEKQVQFGEAARWLPEPPPDHNADLIGAMGGNADFICNLEPDLLGEFFILEQMKKPEFNKQKHCKLHFVSGAFQIAKEKTGLLLYRIMQDFPEKFHELRFDFNELISDTTDDSFANISMGLVNISIANSNWTEIEKIFTRFDDIQNKRGKGYLVRNADVALSVVDFALLNKQWNHVDKTFSRLVKIWQESESNAELALKVAIAAFNITNTVGPLGDRSRVDKMLALLSQLLDSFNDDSEIALTAMKAAVNTIDDAGAVGNWDRVEAMLEQVDRIRTTFADDVDIALGEANAAITITYRAAAKAEWVRVERAIERFERLRQSNSIQGENRIDIMDARLAFRYLIGACANKDWNRVDDALSRLDGLRNEFGENREIAEIEAMSIADLVWSACYAKELSVIEKAFTHIYRLREDFEKDLEIANIEAMVTTLIARCATEWRNEAVLTQSYYHLAKIAGQFDMNFVVTMYSGRKVPLHEIVTSISISFMGIRSPITKDLDQEQWLSYVTAFWVNL